MSYATYLRIIHKELSSISYWQVTRVHEYSCIYSAPLQRTYIIIIIGIHYDYIMAYVCVVTTRMFSIICYNIQLNSRNY